MNRELPLEKRRAESLCHEALKTPLWPVAREAIERYLRRLGSQRSAYHRKRARRIARECSPAGV